MRGSSATKDMFSMPWQSTTRFPMDSHLPPRCLAECSRLKSNSPNAAAQRGIDPGSPRCIRFRTLFEDVVGTGNEAAGDGESKLLGGCQIDHKFEARRPRDREVCRFSALENASHIDASLPICVRDDRPITHETAGGREFAPLINGRNRVSLGEPEYLGATAVEQWVSRH